jgi:hypothetical protein
MVPFILGEKISVLSSRPFSGVRLVTVTSTSDIGEGLPAWRRTAITAKIDLDVKISPGSLDYARVLASNHKQTTTTTFFIQKLYCQTEDLKRTAEFIRETKITV